MGWIPGAHEHRKPPSLVQGRGPCSRTRCHPDTPAGQPGRSVGTARVGRCRPPGNGGGVRQSLPSRGRDRSGARGCLSANMRADFAATPALCAAAARLPLPFAAFADVDCESQSSTRCLHAQENQQALGGTLRWCECRIISLDGPVSAVAENPACGKVGQPRSWPP
jgi:hypothetical protein